MKSGVTYIYGVRVVAVLAMGVCVFFFFFFTYNKRSSQTVNKKTVKDLIGQMVQQKQSIKSNKTLQFAIHK